MSLNRLETALVEEMTWDEFLAAVGGRWVRVQGRSEAKTHAKGRLVRYNRAVQVYPDSAGRDELGRQFVRARRVMYDMKSRKHFLSDRWMTITRRSLNWFSFKWSGDPNFHHIKVL